MKTIPILLVDDTEANLFIYEEIFNDIIGIVTVKARSGLEAIALSNENEFGLILCDVNMPGMNGFETIKNIRKIEWYKKVSVIFVTAVAFSIEDILLGYNVGAIDYVTKPYNINVLKNKVSNHLDVFRQRIQLEHQNIELSNSKKFIETITSAISEAIIYTNKRGFIKFCNFSAQRLYGYSQVEMDHKKITDLVDTEKAKVFFDKLLSSEVKISNHESFEVDMSNKNGNKFPVEFTLSRIDSIKDESFIFVVREITSKKIEEEHKVKSLEYKEANKVMSDFIDNMNHEFRTPLNQIIGISTLMLKYEKSLLNDDQIEAVSTIASMGEKLLETVDKLLQFRDTSPVKLETITINEILNAIKKLTKKFFIKKEINYKVETENPLPDKIVVDIQKFIMSIEQIILNAIKFTYSGEIKITVSSSGDDFLFQIKDSGIGMTESVKSNIFNKFYQANSSLNKEYDGVGMGLTLANKYIQEMSGRIKVESTLGKGSTFTIILPILNDQ